MKKNALGALYKRILPLLMCDRMEVLCKGRDGRKIFFFTYLSDEPYPVRDAIYIMPCKDGVVRMHGRCYINSDDNVDVDWWLSELTPKDGSKKTIPPIEVDWDDPSWRVDRESLKKSLDILKSEFDLLKQTYEDGVQFLNGK